MNTITRATPTRPPPTANGMAPPKAPRRGLRRMTARPQARGHTAGYSRFVVLMRMLLPTVAVLLVGLVAAWPYLQTTDTRFRIGFAALKARESENPAMVNPRYVGTDKSSQPFSITADLAKNLMSGQAEVELEMPKADVTLEDGTWLVLTAENGVYSRRDGTLDLVGAVNLFHDSGYEIRTDKAVIGLGQGVAQGNAPVAGQGPFGNLTSEGFRLENKGKVIVFTGKAKLVLHPGGDGGQQ